MNYDGMVQDQESVNHNDNTSVISNQLEGQLKNKDVINVGNIQDDKKKQNKSNSTNENVDYTVLLNEVKEYSNYLLEKGEVNKIIKMQSKMRDI